jgi:uncharacterized protein YuzE
MRPKVDTESDALYFRLDESEIIESEEVEPGVILDFNADGNVVGIEILDISNVLPLLWKIVIGVYLNDDINLSKAAELLGKHPVELRNDFIKQGIQIKIGAQSLEEVKAKANALLS